MSATKMEHTLGPWYVDECGMNLLCIRSGKWSGRVIAEIPPSLAVYEANARLIASAPELLEALKAAFHALKSYEYGNTATDLAEEAAKMVAGAIAKAEGRE